MGVANQGRLDGLLVEVYDGRFGGTFEMDREIGEGLAFDDVVTFLVVAVAGKSNFGANKSGDLKRTNVFEVSEVSIVPNELAVKVANEVGAYVPGVNFGQLALGSDPLASFDEDDDDDDDITEGDESELDPRDPDDFSYLDDDDWAYPGDLADAVADMEKAPSASAPDVTKEPSQVSKDVFYEDAGWS